MSIRKADYPADWDAISREVRFDRAGGRCECRGECGTRGSRRACADPDLTGRCRAEHGRPHPRTTSIVVLTTAHLDDNPASADRTRTIAFCQSCHLAYDAGVHKAKRQASARGELLELFPEETT